MKYKLLLLLLIIPFFLNAQKSSYVKNRLTFDISYMQMNYGMIPEYKEKRNGALLSANYGITKFLESGLYYYRLSSDFLRTNFFGIQNRFHLLPFFVESDSKYFRLDAYVFNQTGMYIYINKYSSINSMKSYNTDVGIGTSLYLFKHIGVRLEYKWGFILTKHVENHNFQNGFSLGLSFKF